MKVKFFEFLRVDDGEKRINEWLEHNSLAKIKFITHAETGKIPGSGAYGVISIWYEK